MGNQQHSFFFSDIAGYSKMVERDETLSYRLLQEHNKIIEECVTTNDGRVVKYIGDSVFAEFESPDNACSAAITIQSNFKKRNTLSRKDEQIHIRLGIHSGEVIREGEDLFGNDINIASRIESVAQPDSVFISDSTYQNLLSVDKYYSRKVENVKLKNIKTIQTLHKLYLTKKDKDSESSSTLLNAMVETGANIIDKDNILDYETRSIGVLIFNCPDDPYYGYGLCNDLISEFNRISQIYVSDIQDVIKYKDSEFSNVDIARKLEVDNILDGIIRIEGNRICLSIRLVSMESGKTIWKEELSDLTANINALRGTIIKKALDVLDIQVPDIIMQKISTGMTSNPEAYKLYHEGLYKIEIVKNTEEFPAAKLLFSEAIEKDEHFVEAYAQKAITASKMGHVEEAEELIDKGIEKAEYLDRDLGKAKLLFAMGYINTNSVKIRKAVKNFEKALKIQVKYDDQLSESKTLNNLSHCYTNLGEPDQAIDLLQKSIHLKLKLEKDDLLGAPLANLGTAYRNKFQYGKAVENYKKAIGKFSLIQNDYQKGRILLLLARCLCDMGLADKAEVYLKKGHKICQRFNEPLIMGRINNFQANINLLRQDYDKAIHCFEESLEIFRDGELRKPSAEIMLEMMCAHVTFDHPEKLEPMKIRYERIIKKLSGSSKSNALMGSIEYYINVHFDPTLKIDFHEIENEVTKMQPSESQYLTWWFLAKTAAKSDNLEKEKDYNENSAKIIHQLGDMIGDKLYHESFLHKFPISEILALF